MSVCLCFYMCIPLIIAREWLGKQICMETNARATIDKLLDASFSYAVCVISKESRRLVLPITSCVNHNFTFHWSSTDPRTWEKWEGVLASHKCGVPPHAKGHINIIFKQPVAFIYTSYIKYTVSNATWNFLYSYSTMTCFGLIGPSSGVIAKAVSL
jgi:hypothetical protein